MTESTPSLVPQPPSDATYTPPTIRFTTLTFSDETTIELGFSDIIVLVGPNNAGKSVALQELEQWVRGRTRSRVIHSASITHSGTPEDFSTYLTEHTQITVQGGSTSVKGPGFSIGLGTNDVKTFWPHQLANFAPLFCARVKTETRITDSDPAPAFAALTDAPSTPIHLLYQNDEIEKIISDLFQMAFGQELIVFRLGGVEVPLLVGTRPDKQFGEDRLSNTYNKRLLLSSSPLQKQGDGMRSFASVILRLLAPTTPSILLLDEPEAFLHPPQARLLGEIIARNKPTEAQLFVATHSPDVLHGLIANAPNNLHVLRMQREGNVNRVQELDKKIIGTVSRDPLMMQSSILSGVFHERVIICEADADCMFYRSVLNVAKVHGGHYPDVMFVHANGKHRMATLASTMRQLDVPVDVVADIDVLNDETVLRNIVEALGGNWGDIVKLAEGVKRSIEEHKPWLTGQEIKKGIEKVLEQVPETGAFPRESRSQITEQFRKASPWDAVKQSGAAAIPTGDTTQKFNELMVRCQAMGLWIVPVGELEGFCRAIGGHGPKWVQNVLEARDLANDPELQEAREFLSELWAAKRGKTR